MAEIKINGYQCEHCGHEWVKRTKRRRPVICPKCKSPYWNEPRKQQEEKSEN